MVTTRRTFSLALAFVQGVSLLMGGSATATGNRVPISEAASACGASWQSVPSPSLWPDKSTFKGIAAAAPNDVWVVGSVQPAMRDTAALIEHWDGKEWSQVPAPKLYPATDLAAVVALGPHNVWAVGQWATHDMTGIGLAKIVTLILHWDGATWSVVPSPNDPASTSSSTLTGVAASGPSDIWAIGQVDDWSTGLHAPLILHWDGVRWSNMPTGDLGPGVKLYGVAAGSPSDAWVVGDAAAETSTPLIAHWDGHTWTRRADAGDRGYLTGMVVTAADDAWAVGTPGLVRHWDGHAWTASPEALATAFGNQLSAVAGSSSKDVWAVGGGFSGNPLLPLSTLHWDGSRWTAQPNVTQVNPGVGVEATHLAAVTSAGPGDFWAVGDSLIAHYTDPCAAGPQASHSAALVADPHDPAVSYFPQVGHTLRGAFHTYWQSHGGLSQFGYPLTEQFSETSPTDGNSYTVQYFERAVFELHPGNKAPFDVLLSLLGVFRYKAEYPGGAANQAASRAPGAVLFKETGKTVGGPFLAYWKSHGGLAQQGFPISEEFQEKSELDGKTYKVQYFERAVFEYHPENAGTPYEVLLSQLGRYEYERRHATPNQPLAIPPPRPGFRQWAPHGSDSYLIWTEMSYDVPGEDHVFALDRATGQVSMVTSGPGRQDGEDLSGSIVLWKDQGLCPTPCNKSEIHATDLATGQVYGVALGPDYNGEARISGHTVAWISAGSSNPRIMLRDLDSGVVVTVTGQDISRPVYIAHVALSDEYVAWDGVLPTSGVSDDQPYQVHAYNRRTHEIREVAGGVVSPYEQAPELALSGAHLVWLDARLHAADLSTGEVRTLPLQNGDSPMLRDDILVWHWQHAILAAHLDNAIASPVVIGDLVIDYGAPTLTGAYVVWETETGPDAGHLGARHLPDPFNLTTTTLTATTSRSY